MLFNQQNKISIITKSDIRYEGILSQINTQEQNIALTNVLSYGTEGRRPDNEIPQSNVVYDYIVFRGADIKDLSAIDNTGARQQSGLFGTTQTPPPTQPAEEKKTNEIEKNTQINVNNNKPLERKKDKINDGDEAVYDFEEMNKNLENQIHIKSGNVQTYAKKGFFDDISNSTTEKNTRQTRDERFQEIQVDNETFGSDNVSDFNTQQKSNNYRGNNNYRGRGRGRGRGGNNQRYNNDRNYNNYEKRDYQKGYNNRDRETFDDNYEKRDHQKGYNRDRETFDDNDKRDYYKKDYNRDNDYNKGYNNYNKGYNNYNSYNNRDNRDRDNRDNYERKDRDYNKNRNYDNYDNRNYNKNDRERNDDGDNSGGWRKKY